MIVNLQSFAWTLELWLPWPVTLLTAARVALGALGADDLQLDPLSHWRSPRTGAAYPSRLRLRVPRAGLDGTVTPLLVDAEIDARPSTGVIYWEGPVALSGTASGEGYMELSGYASSLTGRF